MTFIKPLLVSFSLLAFAGAAIAADDAKNKTETKAQSSSTMKSDTKAAAGATKERTFGSLDTNKDGSIQRAEIAAHADLAVKFKAADKNSDGKLSRSEYDAMAKAEGGAAAGGTMKKNDKAAAPVKKEEKKPAK
jgi:Ca2+-binding EF-hand superfamily protein